MRGAPADWNTAPGRWSRQWWCAPSGTPIASGRPSPLEESTTDPAGRPRGADSPSTGDVVPRVADDSRCMTTAAIAVVLLVLAATNVWVHLGPSQVHLVTGPLAALLLLLIGKVAGLTRPGLGPGAPGPRRGRPGGAL